MLSVGLFFSVVKFYSMTSFNWLFFSVHKTHHSAVVYAELSGCNCNFCNFHVKLRQELEKVRRRLEVELADTREQLAERTSQLHDVQAQLNRREQELQTALNR